MAEIALFYRFAVAAAIGLLIGLQREFAYGDQEGELFAGVRTFALAALTGCAAAFAAVALVGLGYAAYLYFTHRPEGSEEVSFSNPFRLGPAIQFGLLYAVVLVAFKAAHMYLGDQGLLVSSAVAGSTDADAITLSLAQLSSGPDAVAARTATQALVLAALSNTLVKAGIVLVTGSRGLRRALLPGVGLMLAAGIAAILLV